MTESETASMISQVIIALAASIDSGDSFTKLATEEIYKRRSLVPTPEHLAQADYEPSHRKYMLMCDKHESWQQGEREELQSIEKNCVWTREQPPYGTKVILLKWVYKVKKDRLGANRRYKCRLVAQGFFQVFVQDYTDTYSPVAKFTSIPYGELIGSLLWVANGTRPDVLFAVNTLAKFTSNPGLLHWKALLRVLGYLYATKDYWIKYQRNPEITDGIDAQGCSRGFLPLTELDAYVDASFAGDVDTRRSTTGYEFKISGGPVSWQSRMQTSVALPSMEAEYMAASAATQEAMWLNKLLHQLGFRTPRPTVLYEDNKAAILFADQAH
jgi:Reverse transcriptase (RNA-dependent DNA polymerase)